MLFQSSYFLLHFYWIPGANYTLLKQFSSKHLQKLQEIQSLRQVTKHDKRLLFYIHIADCKQKTVNRPTTSVVDKSLFASFSNIFQPRVTQQAQISHFPERWRKMFFKVISALSVYFALQKALLQSFPWWKTDNIRFWLEGPLTSARIQTKAEQKDVIRNARTGRRK